jgi:hypothetical protein
MNMRYCRMRWEPHQLLTELPHPLIQQNSSTQTGMFSWYFPFPSPDLSSCCFSLSYGRASLSRRWAFLSTAWAHGRFSLSMHETHFSTITISFFVSLRCHFLWPFIPEESLNHKTKTAVNYAINRFNHATNCHGHYQDHMNTDRTVPHGPHIRGIASNTNCIRPVAMSRLPYYRVSSSPSLLSFRSLIELPLTLLFIRCTVLDVQ